jgi:hypothetical protein
MERRLPKNAAHIRKELEFTILTPIGLWEVVKPWAALFV